MICFPQNQTFDSMFSEKKSYLNILLLSLKPVVRQRSYKQQTFVRFPTILHTQNAFVTVIDLLLSTLKFCLASNSSGYNSFSMLTNLTVVKHTFQNPMSMRMNVQQILQHCS